jgi:hypothetical protein
MSSEPAALEAGPDSLLQVTAAVRIANRKLTP